ncbi:uncharacterized protein K02A2.6-like [Rhagoletis pomonella]|uniref:uncharacterized protein K02A2.6-like n=1 Tax=Rhagoletis pomonella TaxID=28610 RepID=UPI0017838D71|nr:uncharacterized protein K02A2.6-like [Rhagoletis pomonella]
MNRKIRRVPFPLWEAVEAELDKQVSEGLLDKVDKSEWASPIVVVQKAEGKVRICGDYNLTLNPALRIDEHPLPKIDELFRNTAGVTKFKKIDLSKAYLQLEIHADDRPLLTLSTHRGIYQPTRMMFGIFCAPAVWQRFMENLVGDIPGVTVFLDDIKLAAPDDATHLQRLEEILGRLDNHNMRVNLEKSPAMNMFDRQIQSKLELLLPSNRRSDQERPPKKQFLVGDKVAVRDYLSSAKRQFGLVKELLGSLQYYIRLDDGRTWKRHADQMRKVCERVIHSKKMPEEPGEADQRKDDQITLYEATSFKPSASLADQSIADKPTIARETNDFPQRLTTTESETNNTGDTTIRRSTRNGKVPERYKDFLT